MKAINPDEDMQLWACPSCGTVRALPLRVVSARCLWCATQAGERRELVPLQLSGLFVRHLTTQQAYHYTPPITVDLDALREEKGGG